MITVQILEPTDTIEPNDWARQLYHDDYARNNAYSGKPMNRMGWMIARFVCPFWVGKTVGECNERFAAGLTGSAPYFEFVRGPIPVTHQEELTAEELELCNNSANPVRKRKETGWDRVQANRYKQD